MGKAPKRSRKFLSKNILPRKKRRGRHGDRKSKEGDSRSKGSSCDKPTSSLPPLKALNTLPEDLDTSEFLDCSWFDEENEEGEDGKRNARADWFESDPPVFDVSSYHHDLKEESVRAMVNRAVDEGSIADLYRIVWALQISYGTSLDHSQTQDLSMKKKLGEGQLGALATLSSESLKRLHLAFRFHLGPERSAELTTEEWEELCLSHRQLLEKSESWKRLGGALFSFLSTALDVLRLISRASGRGRQSHLLESLRSMRPHIPLMFPFALLARRYLVCLLALLESSDDSAVLSLAFVRLYELSTSQPMPFLHYAFKGIYRAYRRASDRIGTISRSVGSGDTAASDFKSLPLLRECIAELFGVEKPSAYLHAYVYIHDLVREGVAAADELRQQTGHGGGWGRGAKSGEAGPAMRRLRSWSFLQKLVVELTESEERMITALRTALEGSVRMNPAPPPPAQQQALQPRKSTRCEQRVVAPEVEAFGSYALIPPGLSWHNNRLYSLGNQLARSLQASEGGHLSPCEAIRLESHENGCREEDELWTCVVAANVRTLGSLIPALAKALEITFELSPGLYGAPRTLTLARCAQDLAAAGGIYLPTSPYLMKLLELLYARRDGHSSGVGADGTGVGDDAVKENRRIEDIEEDGRGGPKEADLSLVAGLGKEDLRMADVRAAIVREAVVLMAREMSCCYRWSAALPEMCSGIDIRLARLLDGGFLGAEGGVGKGSEKCRGRLRWLRGVLEKARAQGLARRAVGNIHPGYASLIDNLRNPVRDVWAH